MSLPEWSETHTCLHILLLSIRFPAVCMSASAINCPSPPCAVLFLQNIEQVHPVTNVHAPSPGRQSEEPESIGMNGRPVAGWLELNGNVKLTKDPFCLSEEGPRHTGEPTLNNSLMATVNTSLSPLFIGLWMETDTE